MRKLKIIEHNSLDGVIQVSAEDGDFPLRLVTHDSASQKNGQSPGTRCGIPLGRDSPEFKQVQRFFGS